MITAAPSAHEITDLLQAWNDGDNQALEKLTPLVCTELYRTQPSPACPVHDAI